MTTDSKAPLVSSNQRMADVPREVLLGKTLRQRAHQLRIEACSAWSNVVQHPIPGLDEAKCDYARAIEERLRAVIDELADLSSPVETSARPLTPNILKHVTSEWATEKNDMAVTVHHRMVEGVLCRWWGDGPVPDGVALIDRAASSVKATAPLTDIPSREPGETWEEYRRRMQLFGVDVPKEGSHGNKPEWGGATVDDL